MHKDTILAEMKVTILNIDEATGAAYWYNEVTGETVWEDHMAVTK